MLLNTILGKVLGYSWRYPVSSFVLYLWSHKDHNGRNWKLLYACFFVYVNVGLRASQVSCYYVHAKFRSSARVRNPCTYSSVYECTLNIILLFLLPYSYRMLHNSFRQFVFCRYANTLYWYIQNKSKAASG